MENKVIGFSEKELLNILSLSKNATAIYSTEDIIIESANDAMIAFWGKDRSVIGKPLADAVPELRDQPFIGMLQRVLKTGITDAGKAIPAKLEISGKLQTFYYDYEYRAINDESGLPYCILHTAHDVTERELNRIVLDNAMVKEQKLEDEIALHDAMKLAQEKLKLLNNELEEKVAVQTKQVFDKDARLNYMMDDAPVAIAMFSGSDMIIESANKKILEAWGKTDDIIGKPLSVALPELAGQSFMSMLDQVFATGEAYYGYEVKAQLELQGVIEDVYSNFVYQPVKNAQGKTNGIILTANVITEEVLARKKVEHAEQMLQFALEAANIGTWYINQEMQTINISQRLKELLGYEGPDDIGFNVLLERVQEDSRGQIIRVIDNAALNNNSFDLSFIFTRFDDNSEVWLKCLGKLGESSSGKRKILSGVVMNITEQKRDEQRKNDFIGMVSHELKTPLTSLTGYIQLLQVSQPANNSFAAGALDKANKQVVKMSDMINSFLTISRLETGKIHLVKQEFDIDELLQEVIADTANSDQYVMKYDPCGPLHLCADRDKIGSVLSNLLSNAIKYSPAGGTIAVYCRQDESGIRVSVEDKGIGIDKEHLEKLFHRYYRVDNQHSEKKYISGFGIGLYLSAEIIQRHNGKIWAESETGVGSTFHFVLPPR